MASTSLATRLSLGLVPTRDRAIVRALNGVQAAALVQRAADAARRDLTIARISDVGLATRHALAEGDEIVGDLERRVTGRPLAFKALAPIAEDGIADVRHELRRLREG